MSLFVKCWMLYGTGCKNCWMAIIGTQCNISAGCYDWTYMHAGIQIQDYPRMNRATFNGCKYVLLIIYYS